MSNSELQAKIDGWEGKALTQYQPVLYRQWRATAVILLNGVRRSKKPTGACRGGEQGEMRWVRAH